MTDRQTPSSGPPPSPATAPDPLRVAATVQHLTEVASAEVGEHFFGAMAVGLAGALAADYTLIGELESGDEPVIATLAATADGQLVENFRYDLAATPCANVIDEGVCLYPLGVAALFPEDLLLVEMEVEGYIGVPLRAASGRPLGIMVALYRSEVTETAFAETIMRIFASRAANEIERARNEEKVRRLAAAMEQSGESVIITDAGGDIVYVNPSFERLSGYRASEVLGRNPRLLKSGDHDEEFYRRLADTVASGGTWTGRITSRDREGRLFHEQGSISPVRDDAGRITNFVAVKRDISRERDLEARLLQAQKMEAVGQLAGGVAHDFNNLLQVILGYGEMVAGDLPADSEAARNMGVLLQAGESARQLVGQLLAFGRRQFLHMEMLDPDAVLAGLLDMVRRVIGEHIRLVFRPGADGAVLRGDRTQLEQILLNLCVNARDAMPAGGELVIATSVVDELEEQPLAELGVKPADTTGRWVRLSVRDTGTGISPEIAPMVFEPFSTTKDVGEGSGLGLATVHGIVSQHGGFVTFETGPDKGTEFRVHLPETVGSVGDAPGAAAEAPRRADVTGGDETILLVEDDEGVRRLVRAQLAAAGYHVQEAVDGQEAVEAFTADPSIELVIMDVMMPRLGGRVAFEQMVASRPDMRVLFVSGYSLEAMDEGFVLAPGQDLLTKPFGREQLLARVRAILDGGTPPA